MLKFRQPGFFNNEIPSIPASPYSDLGFIDFKTILLLFELNLVSLRKKKPWTEINRFRDYPFLSLKSFLQTFIHEICICYSGKSSGLRIKLLIAPSQQFVSGKYTIFVPDHSDGLAPDFNGVPF